MIWVRSDDAIAGEQSRKSDSQQPFPTHSQQQGLSVGALGEIRTPDPQIRSLMLYPAELRAPRMVGGTIAALRFHSTAEHPR
jgi:hypothetical protein